MNEKKKVIGKEKDETDIKSFFVMNIILSIGVVLLIIRTLINKDYNLAMRFFYLACIAIFNFYIIYSKFKKKKQLITEEKI